MQIDPNTQRKLEILIQKNAMSVILQIYYT